MATPLLQKVRQRKMIYFGLIIALFTLSLVHRQLVLKPKADRLQLRETVLGEVELLSSGSRVVLTGSRGLMVTILWYNAIEKQKRGEWNELELLVKSITKLQPYFITPWLYQSWNISFNVAVECDDPRDKYYYISRGLELLAEGERRNSGTAGKGAADDPDRLVIPGNPELRHFMGFIYQLKIGSSDEHKTMRSLLEMSCIDPIQRNPDRFVGEKGQVNLDEFKKFAESHPRLVRRLNEQLGKDKPDKVVKFLRDHQNIPNRFKPIDKNQQASIKVSERKHAYDQFPILPPKEGRSPDPDSDELTSTEAIDVFLICRTWYEYAQKPLPPEEESPVAMPRDYDKLRYRVPKGMVIQLFRQYPARAQVYIAETLESEGFFDDSGWSLHDSFKFWYPNEKDFIYGTLPKYHSQVAWREGHRVFKKFGEKNGIYLTESERRELNQKAGAIRAAANAEPDAIIQQLKSEWREGPLKTSYDAHMRLAFSRFYAGLTNFESFLHQAEGEMDDSTVAMRKTLFQIVRDLKEDSSPNPKLLAKYQRAWDLYLYTCLKHPRFAAVTSMQEDIYEVYQRYLKLRISAYKESFKGANVAVGRIAFLPAPGPLEAMGQWWTVHKMSLDEQQMTSAWKSRVRYGPLDTVQYYDGPNAQDLKLGIISFLQGASITPNPALNDLFPGREYFVLTGATTFLNETPLTKEQAKEQEGWKALITPYTRNLARERNEPAR